MSSPCYRTQISQDLIDQHDRFSTSSNRCIQFEIQAALIADENKFEYRSLELIQLVRTVEQFVDSESPEEYLYFYGISDREYELIDNVLRQVALRSTVRFTFENALNAAILHIRPGLEHNMIACNFVSKLEKKLASIPGNEHSVSGFGAALFQTTGVRSKEGDQCLRPRTRKGRHAWPSVMIEAGYSKGKDFLSLDAEWWLINSEGSTRFVIIIIIERDPWALRIECWKMIETGRRETRQTPARMPRCVQDFNINEAGAVVSPMESPELSIPYECIFDKCDSDSPPLPPVTLSFLELSKFALFMFEQLE